MCSGACWTPPCPLMPKQASLFGSNVPLDSPLEGHSLWNFASITTNTARSSLFYLMRFDLMLYQIMLLCFNLFYFIVICVRMQSSHRVGQRAARMQQCTLRVLSPAWMSRSGKAGGRLKQSSTNSRYRSKRLASASPGMTFRLQHD